MGSRRSVFYAYIHKSSTQDAPVLRTRDGGLKILYDWSTLPTHPVLLTLRYNYLHFVFSYIRTLGSFQGLGICKTVVQLRQLLFKGLL